MEKVIGKYPHKKIHFTGKQFPAWVNFTRGDCSKTSEPLYHHGIEILFNFGGAISFFSRDRLFILNGNSALIIWPNDIHVQETIGHIESSALVFIPSRLFQHRADAQSILDCLHDVQYLAFTERQMISIGFLLREIKSELITKPQFWENVVTDNIVKLLVILTRAKDADSPKPVDVQDDVLLGRVIEIIHAHLHQSITLAKVAKTIDCSPYVLCRFFKKQTGVGFKEFLTHSRILRAREILRESERKIEVVAREVGYRETSTFNRNFKRLIGMSPSAYRLMSAEEK